MPKLTAQVRQIMAHTNRLPPAAKAALEARLLAILDVVVRCTTPVSVQVLAVPDQENAIGLKIQLVQQPGQLRPPVLSVRTRYLLAEAERDVRQADTTILLFHGDHSDERQELHHARAVAQVYTYLRLAYQGVAAPGLLRAQPLPRGKKY